MLDREYYKYPEQNDLAESSFVESEIREIFDLFIGNPPWVSSFREKYPDLIPFCLAILNTKLKLFKKPIIKIKTFFEIDLSSVLPIFERKSEPSLIAEYAEDQKVEEIKEFDRIVNLSPKKKYKIELEIKKIRKAEPKFVNDYSL